MKKYDRIAALFLTLFGLTTGVHSWLNLGLGSMDLPAAGFMPFVSSTILTVSSAVWLISSLGKDPHQLPFWEGRGWLKPTLATVFMLAYAWSIDKVGYLLATLAFMLVWQFVIEREKWLKGAIISVVTTVVLWYLFSKLLAVPLPTGMLTV